MSGWGWKFVKDDRIRVKANRAIRGTVVAREDGGTYTVRYDNPDDGIEYGCREHLMEKIK